MHRIEANWNWFTIGSLGVDVGMLVDGMTAVMLVVVTLVSFLVHVFSTSYMAGDRRYTRFFAFLGWFTFSMMGIVLSNSIFFLYIFWELVGVASYVLIGFFFHKESAAQANKKAFLVNRGGDFGFWMGILFFFTAIGSFNYFDLFDGVAQGAISGTTLSWAGILLFFGCIGKSAQVPLHVWLPDAMEGPTPVSALIHAATMVAAGVYMTARLFPLFDPNALLFIAYTGGVTAIFAATIAIVQTDIKKGLAYSTISQLGYMVMAVGVGGVMAGMFHLTTHAMFKACLFLGSGSVIHAMHHHQEMGVMGGLRHKMPITFITFLAATIAISGVPPFAGFWSKDAVLAAALAFGMQHPAHYAPFIMALLAASITAFYMFRIVILTFMGKPKDQKLYDDCHENGFAITMPLVVLGTLAVIAGGNGWISGWNWFERFVTDPVVEGGHAQTIEHLPSSIPFELVGTAYAAPQHGDEAHVDEAATEEDAHAVDTHAVDAHAEDAHAVADDHGAVAEHGESGAHADDHHDIHHIAHERAMWLSILAAGLGIFLAFWTYHWKRINSLGVLAALPGVHRVLKNNYYVDEAYRDGPIAGTLWLAKISSTFDKYIVDGIVNGVGSVTLAMGWVSGSIDRWFVDGLVNAIGELMRSFGGVLSGLQTGRMQNYLLGLVSGLVILVLVYRVAWPS
jgi:NADH-quinone oxidoreductase subunit L